MKKAKNKKQRTKNIKQGLKVPISEIFFSYQGEGIYVGQPQIFIRFSGCNLRCNYCDTVQSQMLNENQVFLTVGQIIEQIKQIAKKNLLISKNEIPITVSITGGEPLLYERFLKELLPKLKKLKCKIYLETNGIFYEAFKNINKWVDIVAMDIKLASDCGSDYWKEHKKFIELSNSKVFIKLVVTGNTTQEEVNKAVKLVQSINKEIPFIFQPVTPVNKCGLPQISKVNQWTNDASTKLDRVQVIAQMHKIWKIK